MCENCTYVVYHFRSVHPNVFRIFSLITLKILTSSTSSPQKKPKVLLLQRAAWSSRIGFPQVVVRANQLSSQFCSTLCNNPSCWNITSCGFSSFFPHFSREKLSEEPLYCEYQTRASKRRFNNSTVRRRVSPPLRFPTIHSVFVPLYGARNTFFARAEKRNEKKGILLLYIVGGGRWWRECL